MFEFSKKKYAMGAAARRAALRMLLGGLASLALAAGAQTATDWVKDPSRDCRFVVPASLKGAATYWVGACPGGKAAGLGMLRNREGAKAGNAFYGEMREGIPVMGAIDFDGGGYRVGRFVEGDLGSRDGSWQERHDGFEAALRAARAVSAHYVETKNPASARHYAEVARQLDIQLDAD
ncbi:hypothetical protein [Variovorax paradoxus]|uniref:hypothetical protein n=1 Tax=Variovorax paradoxus TaxID=34073 RepID=UPI001ABBE5EE